MPIVPLLAILSRASKIAGARLRAVRSASNHSESVADCAASASVASGVYGAAESASTARAVDRGRVGLERSSASEQGGF